MGGGENRKSSKFVPSVSSRKSGVSRLEGVMSEERRSGKSVASVSESKS